MTSRIGQHRALTVLLFLLAAAMVTATIAGSRAIQASAGQEQLFVGVDPNGNLQAALADALRQASDAQGCCDKRFTYKVTTIKGTVGGIVYTNEIRVTIRANW